MRWIVVGGGAAGCAIASRLAAHPDDQVVVLEAGPATTDRDTTVLDTSGLDTSGLDTSGPDTGPRPDHATFARNSTLVTRRAGGPATPYAQGFGVGGGSLINGGIVTATVPPELVDLLPLEKPAALGPVGRALLAADPSAAEVRLIRSNGRRVDAAQMLLAPLLDPTLHRPFDRGNISILTGSAVRGIVVSDRRAIGVVTVAGDEHLGDAVVLCAGAIDTPTLLLRSGIDAPGIGAGLQDHPALRIAFDLDAARFDPALPAISVTVERGSHQILGLNHVRPDMALGVLMAGLLRVESRGQVTLPDLDGPPDVNCNMLATAADRRAFGVAAADLLAIARRQPIRDVAGEMYLDDHGTSIDELRTDQDLVAWAMTADLSGYHHVAASCRRGIVTDAHGWVRGYERLAIADASLFDAVPANDPYIAVVAQAVRMATPAFLHRYR